MGADGGVDQDERGEDGEKGSDFVYFFEVLSGGSRDRFNVWLERQRGINNDTKIFSLRNWKDEFAFY